jgi:hypothetical protein
MAIRMEQAVFKMLVEMCYEAEACDMIQRALDGAEEDFNEFKRVSKISRIHNLCDWVYSNKHAFKYDYKNPCYPKAGPGPNRKKSLLYYKRPLPPANVKGMTGPDSLRLRWTYTWERRLITLDLARTKEQKKEDQVMVVLDTNAYDFRAGLVATTFNDIKRFLYEELRDAYLEWRTYAKKYPTHVAFNYHHPVNHRHYLQHRIVPITWTM